MEYLPGLSLAELVESYGPLPPARAVYLLRQVCGALREAHAAGLIHRDIKPSNIIAAQRGGMDDVAKLLDFGLVRSATTVGAAHLSAEDQILGTPLYMSPEQATASRRARRAERHLLSGGCGLLPINRSAPVPGRRRARGVDRACPRPGGASLARSAPAFPQTWIASCCSAWPRTRPSDTRMPPAWSEPWVLVPARRIGTKIKPLGGGGTTAGHRRRELRPDSPIIDCCRCVVPEREDPESFRAEVHGASHSRDFGHRGCIRLPSRRAWLRPRTRPFVRARGRGIRTALRPDSLRGRSALRCDGAEHRSSALTASLQESRLSCRNTRHRIPPATLVLPWTRPAMNPF